MTSPQEEFDRRRGAQQELEALQRGDASVVLGKPLASIPDPEPLPMSDKGKGQIISMTFKSSSDDVPHVVTLGPDGVVRCTCKAMLSIESRPTGCWAMADFRRVVGIHSPTPIDRERI